MPAEGRAVAGDNYVANWIRIDLLQDFLVIPLLIYFTIFHIKQMVDPERLFT